MSTMIDMNCELCQFPIDGEIIEVDGRPYCSFCAPTEEEAVQKAIDWLRIYQSECVDSVFSELESVMSTLVVMPTGTGKTVVFAAITQRMIQRIPDKRVLVMAHRDELIQQAADKITRFTGLKCDIEKGEQRADQCSFEDRAPVIVTSVQTMCRENRMNRFHPEEFSLLVIDEAHHATAPTYRAVINYFRSLKILGVTATPDRADEAALGRVFESVAYDYKIVQAIDDGWLVPINQQFVQIDGLDLSTVTNVGGDLNQGQLARIVEQEKILHGYADPTMRIVGNRKTLMFAVSIDQSEQLCNIFNRHKPESSRWICGEEKRCPMQLRRETLKAFTRGDFQFLVNCQVLLEGYDEPTIEAVAVARPTKSRPVYAQMIGRGTRPLSGLVDTIGEPLDRRVAIASSAKPNLMVLDFCGNAGRHKLMHTGDLLGGDYDDDVVAEATRAVASKNTKGELGDMLDELRAAEAAKKQRLADARRVRVQAKYTATTIDPFGMWDILPKREPGWFKGKKPTEGQKAWLVKQKAWKEDMTFWDAKQMLDEFNRRRDNGLCTYAQAKCLARFGFDTENMSFQDARDNMDRLKQNGWKR